MKKAVEKRNKAKKEVSEIENKIKAIKTSINLIFKDTLDVK